MKFFEKTNAFFWLIFLQIILTGIIAGVTSLNRTETGHLGAAVYFYETARGDVFCVNPPLARIISGLPIRLMSPQHDWKSYSPRPQDRAEWSLGAAFINANTDNKIHTLVWIARLALFPFILFGIWFGWKIAVSQYGFISGVLFVSLWTFSPLILAWSATICPDALAATMGLIGIYTLRNWLKSPDWWNASVAGLVLGTMLLTKTTWIIAGPIYFLIWVLWRWIPDDKESLTREECTDSESLASPERTQPVINKPGFRGLILIFCIALYILNMGYLFDGTFTQLRNFRFMSGTLTGHLVDSEHNVIQLGNRFDGSRTIYETLLGYVPVPLPKDFVQGIDTQKYDFECGIESYLNGEFSPRGWKTYYLYVLLYKEPIGFMLLFLIAVGMTFWPKYRLRKEELLVLVPLITLFLFISMQDGISIHPRYILPCWPFMYLFSSRVGLLFKREQSSKFLRGLVLLLLLWGVTSSMLQYPHSMSYFNEWIGAKNGAKYLQGSNVDWGQNNYFLRDWCNRHKDITLRTNYLMKSEVERLGIDNMELITDRKELELVPGWYAISVNDLYGKSDEYHVFQQFEPVDWIGASICIYHLSQDDIDRVQTISLEGGVLQK